MTLGGSVPAGYLPHPSAEHAPDLGKWFGKCNIFFVIQILDFPGDLEKEFEKVELSGCPLEVGELLLFCEIACGKD